ncbi:hypothetical protein [Lacrimispora brassicae]
MKHLKRYIIIILCIALFLLTSCAGDVQATIETTNSNDPDYVNELDVYYSYIRDELIPQYGLASMDSTYGIMQNAQDGSWFNPGGIVSAYIEDMKGDGQKELLLLYYKEDKSETLENKFYSGYNLYAAVYGLQNDIPYKIDETEIYAYSGERNKIYTSIFSNHSAVENLFISTISANGSKYIMIESSTDIYAFADGFYCNYWVLRLEDNKLQIAGSFSQNGVGSSDFEYTGYQFENGNVISEELMYTEEYGKEGRYNNFKTAIEEFFNTIGITVKYNNHNTSILEGNELAEKILSYQIACEHVEEETYKFTLFATDYTDVRTHIKNDN